jgi:xylulose-5-phosphate/fructose-6-phosphate phosphoketolase
MPGEAIKQPNPRTLPSQLPDDVLKLAVTPQRKTLDESLSKSLQDFQNAAGYIAAGM